MQQQEVMPDQDYLLWALLNQVNSAMVVAREKELEPFGISAIQAGAMIVIGAGNEPVPIKEISRWLFRKHHTTSSLISRMEKQGLVKKLRNQPRKGMVGVVLTDEGKDILRRQNEQRLAIHRIVSALTEEERDMIIELLMKLREKALDEIKTGRQAAPP